jgi:integrase
MSVSWRKDIGRWRFRIKRTKQNAGQKEIKTTLPKGITKRRAEQMDKLLTVAWDYNDFRYLDEETRRVCIELFRNYGREIPPALLNSVNHQGSAEELTLIRAIEYTLADPEVLRLTDPTRYEQSFAHVLKYWGPDFAVKDIQIRQVKEYMLKRQKEGASGSTINKERGSLSKMFKVLIEAHHLDRNPVRDTAPASEKDGQRDVYISFRDFQKIVEYCACWAQYIFETLYMSGMRRGEALSLTWEDVNLETRIIRLSARQTKERRPKRVPIHKDLIPIMQAVGKANSWSGSVFRMAKGHSPHEDSLKKPWKEAVESLELQPMPRIHDLRHCWKTNAMRSGLHPLITDAIVGHGDRKKDVKSLYLSISDSDLVREIDRLTFDNGKTEIWSHR